ncbi:MAG: substrate-binding domain-containing protein, partial [Pseudomonadota bacterium]
LCGEPPEGASGLPHVKVDDRAGAAAMTEHLLNRVQGRIGLLTGPQNSVSSANRLAGYRDALGDDFSDRFVMECDADSAYAGETGMRSLLERVPYLDAVFATSDLLAHGALRALDRAGRRIPEDIAVGGFDDSILAAMSTPQLTSVHVPYDEIAQAAVDLIAAKLEDQTAEPVRVTCRLVERAST